MRKSDERRLQKYFINNEVVSKIKYLKHEVPVYDAYEMLKRETYEMDYNPPRKAIVGRIDLLLVYKNIKYATEIKYKKYSSSDFWDALKIIGYTALLQWQEGNNAIKPAIMVPLKKIKLEHQIVAGKLELQIFGVKEKKEEFEVIDVLKIPVWKQN